jgi:NAD(P)H-hydrate repair Nnr-like enzyme with NAD(P)H-hydrate epimerase domain
MDKAHDVESVSFRGNNLLLRVDGKDYEVDISLQSQRLASATPTQRQNFVVSPSGYGIHWPDLDEDLSVDGLIGVRHSPPLHERTAQDPTKDSVQAAVR